MERAAGDGGRGNSGRRKGEGGWDGWLGRGATRACVRKVWDETRRFSLVQTPRRLYEAMEILDIHSRQHAEGTVSAYGFAMAGVIPCQSIVCHTHLFNTPLPPCKTQPAPTEMLNVILLLDLLFILDAALRCN